jgi:hypothetical protein
MAINLPTTIIITYGQIKAKQAAFISFSHRTIHEKLEEFFSSHSRFSVAVRLKSPSNNVSVNCLIYVEIFCQFTRNVEHKTWV